MDWFDRAEQEISDSLERGEIDGKEYQRQMRELRAELRDAASEAGQDAYDNYMGGW